jgi:ferredoxin-NADP reductase
MDEEPYREATLTEAAGTYRCKSVREEAPRVRTFVLAPVDGARLRFRPGQFINVEIGQGPETTWRSFTLSSSPAAPGDELEITVKKQGAGTGWLFENLGPGRTVRLEGPFGRFHPVADQDPLLLVSAGSGATPMISILRMLADTADPRPVHYIHCASTETDLLFRQEVESLAAQRDGLTVDWLVTARDGRPDAAHWRRFSGQLTRAQVFCCGPEGFMSAVRRAHAEAGGEAGRWHEESFVAEAAVAAVPDPSAAADAFPIRFEPAGVEVLCRAGETLLEAGLRAGLPLRSSCRKGMCSTCRLSRLSGEVDMRQDGGLFEDEVEAGDILACCSRPLGPVTLKFP